MVRLDAAAVEPHEVLVDDVRERGKLGQELPHSLLRLSGEHLDGDGSPVPEPSLREREETTSSGRASPRRKRKEAGYPVDRSESSFADFIRLIKPIGCELHLLVSEDLEGQIAEIFGEEAHN